MAAGSIARKPVGQQTCFLRKRVLGTTGNQTVTIGVVPAGANILRVGTAVRVVFSGGAPTISFGTAASPAAYFAAAGAPATTVGRNNVTLLATALLCPDVDTTIVGVVAGGPTLGTLDMEVEYTVPDETP
jgi:hypothetical protein